MSNLQIYYNLDSMQYPIPTFWNTEPIFRTFLDSLFHEIANDIYVADIAANLSNIYISNKM